jgi:hypothetical protein
MDYNKYIKFLEKVRSNKYNDFELKYYNYYFSSFLISLLTEPKLIKDSKEFLLNRKEESILELKAINIRSEKYDYYINKSFYCNDIIDIIDNDIYILYATPKIDNNTHFNLVRLTVDTNFEYYTAKYYMKSDNFDFYKDIFDDLSESITTLRSQRGELYGKGKNRL